MQTKSLSRMGHGHPCPQVVTSSASPAQEARELPAARSFTKGDTQPDTAGPSYLRSLIVKHWGLEFTGLFFPQNDFLTSFDWHRSTWIRKNEKPVFATENLGSPDANPVEETFLPKRPLEAAV